MDAPNKIAAGNRHRAFSFDRAMKFGYHRCNQRQSTVRWRCLSSNVRWRCMNNSYKRLICVAITFGVVCFLVFWGLSVLLWRLFPEQHSTDELMQQLHWTIHVVAEKVGGLILMSLAAFLAARSHRPTWKIG